MPISTSTDAWNNGDEKELLRDNTLEFLREHPDQAYYTRELADEILDTKWAAGEEEERLRQRVGKEEFQENREEYEAELNERQELVGTLMDQIQTSMLRIRIDDLAKEGLVESRDIPAEQTNIPYDWDTVLHHTYAGGTNEAQ